MREKYGVTAENAKARGLLGFFLRAPNTSQRPNTLRYGRDLYLEERNGSEDMRFKPDLGSGFGAERNSLNLYQLQDNKNAYLKVAEQTSLPVLKLIMSTAGVD